MHESPPAHPKIFSARSLAWSLPAIVSALCLLSCTSTSAGSHNSQYDDDSDREDAYETAMPLCPGDDPIDPSPSCDDEPTAEGCPCDEPGETRDCFPGDPRLVGRGLCEAGEVTCELEGEFDARWGRCEGAVLPQRGPDTSPAERCDCFSGGSWDLDNAVFCRWNDENGRLIAAGSTDGRPDRCRTPTLSGNGSLKIPSGKSWTQSELEVDCVGEFRLCATVHAGTPGSDTCELGGSCVDIEVEEAGERVKVPTLGAWETTKKNCLRLVEEDGAFLELTVEGLANGCEDVGDGDGGPRVFHREGYCPPECNDNPNRRGCSVCNVGTSADF